LLAVVEALILHAVKIFYIVFKLNYVNQYIILILSKALNYELTPLVIAAAAKFV